MVMAPYSVLRLPHVGHGREEPDYVLLHISTEGRNENDLDLKLIGTDNSDVFSVSLKQSQTLKLKAKSNKSTAEEWDSLLRKILLGKEDENAGPASTTGVEAVAKVDAQSLDITIQKRIAGITQKLGTLSLPANEEEEIDVFDWCGKTVQARDAVAQQLEIFQTTINDKDAQIKKLQEALANLTTLKKDNETQLLEKFSLLLNEKKLKIRDQQRLLAGAVIDPTRVEEPEVVEEIRIPDRSRPAGPSRKGKRKATSKAEPSDDESETGFEKMEVDQPAAKDSDQELHDTSDDDDDNDTATQTEDEDDEEPPPPPPKEKLVEVKKAPEVAVAPKPAEELPPKRTLPFASKTKPPVKSQEEGSETESDDEL